MCGEKEKLRLKLGGGSRSGRGKGGTPLASQPARVGRNDSVSASAKCPADGGRKFHYIVYRVYDGIELKFVNMVEVVFLSPFCSYL